jgi:thiamine biosynthesis protein ThiS
MKIEVNGAEVEVSDNLTIRQLLAERRVKMPDMVSVELNGVILRRAEFETKVVATGERSSSSTSWEADVDLSDEQLERYSRHILLEDVGVTGQEKLLGGRVLIIGAGGLGAPAALYLAAAGVGRLGIVDSDTVDLSNLQRQVIHHTSDLARPKVASAAEKLRALNPDVDVRTHTIRVEAANIRALIADYDFVIDGTDNFAAKFLINDACVIEHKPFSHAGILRFDGQLITVLPGESACYRCIFPTPPPPHAVPSCSQAGVLGAVAGVVGCLQASEALKFLLGRGELITDALLIWNALRMDFRKVRVGRNPRCAVCGEKPTIVELHDEAAAVCDLREARS